ncbi:MAG: TIM barrel protein [Pirellulales bacterium]
MRRPRFVIALSRLGITHPLSHDSYLINLAAPDDDLWKKSIEAFIIELRRADQLGIPYVVTHPGSFTTTSEAVGLKRITAALDIVHQETDRREGPALPRKHGRPRLEPRQPLRALGRDHRRRETS